MNTPKEPNQRLLEAAMAVLQATDKQQLNIVVLNKSLFYLDLLALRDQGHTVTESAYIALPQGPVVAKYPNKLVKPLQDRGLAEQLEDGYAKPVRVLSRLAEFKFITSDVKKLVQEVVKGVGRFNSTKASDYSHENPGWTIAFEQGQREGRPKPINMLIALQQLADDDDWLSEPLDKETQKIVERAKEANLPW